MEVAAAKATPAEIRLVPVVFCAQIAGVCKAVVRPLYAELRVRTELLAVEIV